MRVPASGAVGFLGSHRTDRLLSKGHTVVGVDNLSTSDWGTLAHLADEPRFLFEEWDIRKPLERISIWGPWTTSSIFASPTSPPECLRPAIETTQSTL